MSQDLLIDPSTEAPSSEFKEGTKFKQLSIDVLETAHRELFGRAITRILSTEISETTYAQIIDGLPLSDVAYDSAGGGPPDGHPIEHVHQDFCPGVLEKTRKFRQEFDPEILRFDSRLLFTYQAAAPGSRAFRTRLIELIAVSVHQIAVILYELNESLHKDDGVTQWQPAEPDEFYLRFWPDGPLPTLFNHPWFIDYQQYPNGTADMAGYWAESRILGGVVLFDRRKGSDSNAVYFHSDRLSVTYRIYELLPEQKQALIRFLTADSIPSDVPIPILGSDSNRNRVDPEEPIASTGIYRDVWERKDRIPTVGDDRLRDVWDKLKFPTLEDKIEAGERARERKHRFEYGDDYEDI
ncbi:hypothetical protein NW762_007641 [Fusarium torreyae]|uniref:Uncharacterized protein n=1 Tax=Fusarium torreyae TaxID=1237075 RepID=A0A9W8RZZ3_9HYPO|nr:hypothetical protein NW762_007641 [Fusarium torreyae]